MADYVFDIKTNAVWRYIDEGITVEFVRPFWGEGFDDLWGPATDVATKEELLVVYYDTRTRKVVRQVTNDTGMIQIDFAKEEVITITETRHLHLEGIDFDALDALPAIPTLKGLVCKVFSTT